jgi:hypothetical protein
VSGKVKRPAVDRTPKDIIAIKQPDIMIKVSGLRAVAAGVVAVLVIDISQG